jgi:phosphoribosylamine--glycine ligase
MKLMVIGSGGREHALAWKLAQSSRVSRVYVAPGNAGTACEEGCVNLPLTELSDLIAFARAEGIAFTVVGPEAPLAAGMVDAFAAAGLAIFGPSRAAAQLEASKDHAKRFMVRHGIPTARFATFTDLDAARAHLEAVGVPVVIKADGLASGKGVVVAETVEHAQAALQAMLADRRLGAAGKRVVIEEFMEGEEASFIAMVSGESVLPLATSQDHKRIFDGDQGPNTGGMGAYSPAPVVTPAVHARVMREIISPTVRGLMAEGTPFTGFLYAGLMIAADGSPRVVEFNVRLGDPETEPILMRLKSDLADLVAAALEGRLGQVQAEWDRRAAVAVVMAAAGYPDAPRKGDLIHGLPAAGEDLHVFHAGTAEATHGLVTAGGRVLCVTALGDPIKVAQQRAYAAVNAIAFEGMQFRRDIAWRACTRRGAHA